MVLRDHTTVARLRLRGTAADPMAVRLCIDRILNETSLAPPALPPSAILCIRSLDDPLPGSIGSRGDSSPRHVAWRRALASAVARMAERAGRPALGEVPSDAPAIVFFDQAELLACLASDWCGGVLAQRWWWRSLYRGRDLDRLAATVWQERAEHVPAAFEHLSRGAWLVSFVHRLDTAARALLLDRVTTTFGLPGLGTELASSPARESGPAHRDRSDDRGPWTPWVPEAGSTLSFSEQCLLGVCLTLQRAPTQARSPIFLQGVRAWIRVQPSIDSRARSRPEKTRDDPGAIAGAAHEAAGQHPQISSDARAPSLSGPMPESGDRQATHRSHLETADGEPAILNPALSGPSAAIVNDMERRAVSETANAGKARLVEAAPLAHALAVTRADSRRSRLRQSAQSADVEARPISRGPATASARAPQSGSPVVTRFGGLFYLINVGIFLELYGDFTSPAKPGIALSIWDFIAAVGERLVGTRLRADPVWPMLARLAGREDDDAPGRDFEPPADWRIPAAWLDPFPPGTLWRRSRMPRTRLQPASRFDRWLDHLMLYLRARLGLALCLPDRRSIGRVLIACDARVFLTDSELHVSFSLAHLPLAIRLSGLDRNPGWVPAAGRHVAFEFE